MNPELENLIELALADGVLTDKEREIILRKAEKLGEDVDEVEMVLDAKFHLTKKENQLKVSQTTKAGVVLKCPGCNAIVPSMTAKCPDCGHEFRNIQASASIQELFRLLSEAENIPQEVTTYSAIEQFTSGGVKGLLFGNKEHYANKKELNEAYHQEKIKNKKKQIISVFPIPNTKEDIIEFLTLALTRAKTEDDLSATWKNKCEQIYLKAKVLFANDKQTFEQIENLIHPPKIEFENKTSFPCGITVAIFFAILIVSSILWKFSPSVGFLVFIVAIGYPVYKYLKFKRIF